MAKTVNLLSADFVLDLHSNNALDFRLCSSVMQAYVSYGVPGLGILIVTEYVTHQVIKKHVIVLLQFWEQTRVH